MINLKIKKARFLNRAFLIILQLEQLFVHVAFHVAAHV